MRGGTGANRHGVQVFAMGDSITLGYGPLMVADFESRKLGQATYMGHASVCDGAWVDFVNGAPGWINFLVLEDYYNTQGVMCASDAAWRTAHQAVINAARARGAYVIFLDGDHPTLSGVTGIDVLNYAVPTPTNVDGIHYNDYTAYALNVTDLLDSLIP